MPDTTPPAAAPENPDRAAPTPAQSKIENPKSKILQDLRNWISLAGAIIALGGIFAFFLLFVFSAGAGNGYVGLLTYLVAPFFVILGLAITAAGYLMRRKARLAAPENTPAATRYAINPANPRHRRLLWAFGLVTAIFLLGTALGTYQTYNFTESANFCGAVCHVMNPEYTTYQANAHARVACAECHVGSGAGWYVKSKINGMRQLIHYIGDTYPRPIPTPVTNLRPARDICEHCHWPEKFTGSIVRSYNHYAADDANTPYSLKLMLNVGGGSGRHTPADGIHWHITSKVEYYSPDEKRQTIPWVRVTAPDGSTTIYQTDDNKNATPPPAEIRVMDCVDCHNRPAHRYTTPNDAVDQALYAARIDPTLPAIKQTAVDALTQPYETETAALAAIPEKIRAKYPDALAKNPHALDATIAAITDIYRANFFPDMKADWSKYPENIGHKNAPGCFRCHDGAHKTPDTAATAGKHIAASDCNSCHTILAQGTGADLAKLAPEGQPFKHPGGDLPDGVLCSDCHTGKNQ